MSAADFSISPSLNANLNEKTALKYGFTTVQDDSALGNPWFQLNTLKRDVPITPNAYEEYNCNGGESFKIEGEVYSTVTGNKNKDSTNVETLQIGIGIYGKKENGDPRWDMCYFTLNENIGRLNAYLTLPDNVRKFGINIQINGTSDFSGILKVRNIKVTRMTDNSLIVNGSITSNKITTDNIAGTNGWINLRSGLFDYGNGKLKWDGKSLTVAGSGTFAGEITAKSGKIGKYRISSDYLITGSGSTCTGMGGNQAFWAGSNDSNNAPFHVSYDGSLYASKANISGTINSTDGSIGGWKIENSSIYVRSTDGLKQTSLNSDSQKIEFKLTRPASAESDESSSFLNISNSNLSPYIELGWMTKDYDGNAYWGNRNYISEDSIAISSKADIDSSVTISSYDIVLSSNGNKLTIRPGYLEFENGGSISPDCLEFENGVKISQNQNVLWSGADYINENQKISLDGNKNISKQLSGICLAFAHFDRSNNSVQWYGMHYYFVPKSAVAVNNGGGTAFTDPYRGMNKYLYIYNDKILGTKQNGTNGSEGGFSYDNRNWVLVKVFGV